MNKKLLAVAVLGALASPTVFAQQAGSPRMLSAQGTTIYGIFDLGYQNASGINNKNKNFINQGMRDPSRFGIRGSEDLDGGMYAMYGFEFNMLLDTGGATDISRLAFAGLGSKSWGELTLGRQYTHLFHTFAVGSAHAYGTFASAFGQTPISIRTSNGVKYSSPVFNGFAIGAEWAPSLASDSLAAGNTNEPFDTTTKKNYYDGAIRWTPGPFGAAAGFGKQKSETGAGTVGDVKISELSANWDNQAFGVYGNYATQKTDSLGTTIADWKTYSVSGVARFGGRHSVYAMYSKAKQDKVAAGNGEATTIGVAYENALSKRTVVYVGYGKTTNKDGMNLAPTSYAAATPGVEMGVGSATANSAAIPLGKDPSAFQVGLSTSF